MSSDKYNSKLNKILNETYLKLAGAGVQGIHVYFIWLINLNYWVLIIMVYAFYTDLFIITNSLIFYLTVIPARSKTKEKNNWGSYLLIISIQR